MNEEGKKIKIRKVDFKVLFNQFYPSLCYYAKKIVGDIETAKDVVQETFVKVWNKGMEFENEYALNAYLYNSVRNNSLNWLSKTSTRKAIIDNIEFDEEESSYLRKQIEAEVITEIYQAIEELPSECKKVFKLSYIKNYQVQEVADELNISINTVKTQRQRAKKFLKERLKDNYLIMLIMLMG